MSTLLYDDRAAWLYYTGAYPLEVQGAASGWRALRDN
jgi:hypothetical protein